MPETPETPQQQATSAGSAAPSSPSGAQAQDDGYDPSWMTKLTPRHKADFEEFTKTLPVYKEREALQNEVSRRQKWGNLTREQVESLNDPMQSLESYKALMVDHGIATAEDMEPAQTPRELWLSLRGRKATAAPTPVAGSKDGEENPFFSQLDAWAQSRGIVPNRGTGPKNPANAPGPSAAGGATVTANDDQSLVNRLARGDALSGDEMARAQKAMANGVYPKNVNAAIVK